MSYRPTPREALMPTTLPRRRINGAYIKAAALAAGGGWLFGLASYLTAHAALGLGL
jgi:hypothetical protein